MTFDEKDFENRKKFQDIISADVKFFQEMSIIDYSLLIGQIVIEPDLVVEMKQRAKVDHESYSGIFFTEDEKAYTVGIIDPLTDYDFKKSIEYHIKRIYHKNHSCVPPVMYADRFKSFIEGSILSNAVEDE